MGTIVAQVIAALSGASIRADEAYPGRRIPALTGPVAAVRLGKIDRSVRTTAVETVIMSPSAGGGSICESTALRAIEVLQNMGGTCTKEVCKFDEMADVFYIGIEAEFFGTALENKWSAGPGYSITVGQQPMEQVVSFSAQRAVSDETSAMADAPWTFVMEELLIPGTSEPPDPAEPFTLTVSRSNGDEQFTGCRFTSQQRQDTIRGVTQIRKGTAERRNVMGIL